MFWLIATADPVVKEIENRDQKNKIGFLNQDQKTVVKQDRLPSMYTRPPPPGSLWDAENGL